jgi:L-rhamnose mutarotase
MERIAFKMKLRHGYEVEYRQRHNAIWPELKELLYSKGIEEYSIFLDEETSTLFGTLKIGDRRRLTELPQHPVMQRWWAFMSDIMETNPDQSPVSIDLPEVFYMGRNR